MNANLGNYLRKFEKVLPYETRVRNAVIQVIQEVLGISLERRKIAVSGPVVTINGSSSLKSEIAMKQVKILARLKELGPDITITKVY